MQGEHGWVLKDYHEESVMTLTYVVARLESNAMRGWLGIEGLS